MASKRTSGPTAKKASPRKRQTVGESIIEGLKEAIAWTNGENNNVRVALVQLPEIHPGPLYYNHGTR